MLAAAYISSTVSAESAVRMKTAAIPHDVALAAGDAGSVRIRTAEPQAQEHGDLRLSCGNASATGDAGAVLRETCPEGAFPLAVLRPGGNRQQRYGKDSGAKR